MYFLQKGVVDVVAEDGQTVFASMERGAFFGEISLLFSCPRTASIRAKTACDMFTLSRAVSVWATLQRGMVRAECMRNIGGLTMRLSR